MMATSCSPVSDAILIAVARLVDDTKSETREPSHSDIDSLVKRARVFEGDPRARGEQVGKAKRVKAILGWAIENNPEAGGEFISSLVAQIRGCGGFRESSPNFVGNEEIRNAIDAFKTEAFELTTGGELFPMCLENLSGRKLTEALWTYVRRAQKGHSDAALLTGTSKDLLEATAIHIISETWGHQQKHSNFPTILGQAFIAVGMYAPTGEKKEGLSVKERLQKALYDVGCAVNQLRNREGTGHGRPWLHSVSDSEAKIAVEIMGAIAEHLLFELEKRKT